jgi:hypothetical protein
MRGTDDGRGRNKQGRGSSRALRFARLASRDSEKAVLKMIEEEKASDAQAPRPGQKKEERQKEDVPTFVIIGASEKALIARGNQSGGLALWTRLPQDIRPVAYKEYPVETADYHLLP